MQPSEKSAEEREADERRQRALANVRGTARQKTIAAFNDGKRAASMLAYGTRGARRAAERGISLRRRGYQRVP